jgi:hypothetical protein
MAPPTVRASELATFSFCQRAWYYARTGVPHEHHDRIQRGDEWHETIERSSRRSIVRMRLGIVLLICGIGISVFYSLIN